MNGIKVKLLFGNLYVNHGRNFVSYHVTIQSWYAAVGVTSIGVIHVNRCHVSTYTMSLYSMLIFLVLYSVFKSQGKDWRQIWARDNSPHSGLIVSDASNVWSNTTLVLGIWWELDSGGPDSIECWWPLLEIFLPFLLVLDFRLGFYPATRLHSVSFSLTLILYFYLCF